jgi:two-component sensor histidine kinase
MIALTVGAARHYLDRQAASAAELEAVARESVHRTKNLIAIVQALTAKVAREVSTVDEFKGILGDRFHALGLAQDLLLRRDWQDANLEELLHTALAPFLRNPALTVQKGAHVLVPARHVRGLCMALYELCTNAMKYGGLAYGRGSVTLTWHAVENDCVLNWREEIRGRDSVLQNQPGLGTLLIRMALSNDEGTNVEYEIGATSVLAAFRWPDADLAARPHKSNIPSVMAEPLKSIADTNRTVAVVGG